MTIVLPEIPTCADTVRLLLVFCNCKMAILTSVLHLLSGIRPNFRS